MEQEKKSKKEVRGMHAKFCLNAYVRLINQTGKAMVFCEVPAIVDADFICDLNGLYSEVLIHCVKEIKTAQFSIVSLKLMPEAKGIKITANLLLTKDELAEPKNEKEDKGQASSNSENEKYRKVNVFVGEGKTQAIGIHRLFKYMEAKARGETKAKFDSLVHIRVVPMEASDLPPEKF